MIRGGERAQRGGQEEGGGGSELHCGRKGGVVCVRCAYVCMEWEEGEAGKMSVEGARGTSDSALCVRVGEAGRGRDRERKEEWGPVLEACASSSACAGWLVRGRGRREIGGCCFACL